jgi:hypothetical protein
LAGRRPAAQAIGAGLRPVRSSGNAGLLCEWNCRGEEEEPRRVPSSSSCAHEQSERVHGWPVMAAEERHGRSKQLRASNDVYHVRCVTEINKAVNASAHAVVAHDTDAVWDWLCWLPTGAVPRGRGLGLGRPRPFWGAPPGVRHLGCAARSAPSRCRALWLCAAFSLRRTILGSCRAPPAAPFASQKPHSTRPYRATSCSDRRNDGQQLNRAAPVPAGANGRGTNGKPVPPALAWSMIHRSAVWLLGGGEGRSPATPLPQTGELTGPAFIRLGSYLTGHRGPVDAEPRPRLAATPPTGPFKVAGSARGDTR